ncbi:unnamed protein product [Echinostoma caproni]|uniref:Protocadherin-11 Y-linked n=1 Tax=Echinostoma caproni TaxID=27848 RepID=A0A183ABS0_9TREM|nr:unnamed protein product [Echinostoma caproni]
MNTAFPITRIYVILPEELPPGSLVVDLNSNLHVKNLQSAFESGSTPLSFQYRLMNTFDGRLFRVGSHSGRMTVASRLDRELLCASQKAQFCCNARASLPSILMSDPNWKEESDPVSKGQRCHLVAHVSIQSTALQHKDAENSPVPNQMALIYVYLRLDDVNDHTPQFTTQSNSLNVAEDTPVSTVLQYFQISDPDAGINGLNQVKLDVNPLTTVDPKTIHDNPSAINMMKNNPFEVKLSRDGVSLLLVHPLDREIVAAYDVVLTAIDGDRLKPRSSQLNIRIHVTDANDNAPVWIQQSDQGDLSSSYHSIMNVHEVSQSSQNTVFNVTVPEGTQVGALIYWLQAKDADVGDNARLQYAIDTSAPGGLTALDYFSVQSTTGEVRLRTQLDYDSASLQLSRPEIEVPVIVRDSPRVGRQLSAKATLVVRITDVNDIYPIIMVSPLQPIPLHNAYSGNTLGDGHTPASFGVWENRPPGQPIASILVNDPDTGDGGKVSCSVQSDFFTLAPESGKSEYFPNYQSEQFLGVKSTLGDTITPSNSGPVTYHLLSKQHLDREVVPRHQVVLTCRDHDRSRPLVSTQRLDIEVLDENDNPPEFSSSPIVLTCPENSPPGQVIGRLNATDKDVGENARLRFWVDDRDASWVGVHAQTGDVRVNTVFDRETETEREFVVYVADSDGSQGHTASTTVKVRVLDENDHAPHFIDLYFFSIPENSPPGTEVGYIRAEDEDEGDNGKVHYLLHPPSRDFELDRDSGKLAVRSSGFEGMRPVLTDTGKLRVSLLDREQQDTYELTVIAEDGGNPPRKVTTVVHIGLSDVNDHAPQFRYPTPHGPGSLLNVSCAQLSSQLIARVHANDSDSGRNGEVEYSIVREHSYSSRITREIFNEDAVNAPSADPLLEGPTANHFEINSYNGQLFLIHPIMDCSRPAEIRLLIRAKDGGDPPLSSTAMLTIYVRPTEDPIDYGGLTPANDYRRTAQTGSVKDPGSLWMSRPDLGKRVQHKSYCGNGDPGVTTLRDAVCVEAEVRRGGT